MKPLSVQKLIHDSSVIVVVLVSLAPFKVLPTSLFRAISATDSIATFQDVM